MFATGPATYPGPSDDTRRRVSARRWPVRGYLHGTAMPDLLLELFSEEIPARMQARAAEDLRKLVTDRLVGGRPRL